MMKTTIYFHVSKEGSCFLHRNCKRTPQDLKKEHHSFFLKNSDVLKVYDINLTLD